MILSPLKPPLTFPTLTGSTATFNAQYALPLKSHTVALTATQSGSGTPSPQNIRTINGYSAINISHSDADTSNPTVYTITIGSTVYGGNYDARIGELTVTHIYLHITTVNVVNSKQAYVGLGSNRTVAVQIAQNELMCNILKPETFSFAYDNHIHFSNVQTLYLYMADEIGATVADWQTWLTNNPLYVCYKLATPTTIQLQPCPIDTLEGVNNIWADTGDTTLQYPKFG